MAGGPTWEGSMNQAGIYRGCPEYTPPMHGHEEPEYGSRSTFASTNFAINADDGHLTTSIGIQLSESDGGLFVAQPLSNDLVYEQEKSVSAFEAYKVYLRNDAGSESGFLNIQVREAKQDDEGSCCGPILKNKQGDEARWELEVLPQNNDNPIETNQYYEIIVDTCMFFQKQETAHENRYYFIFSHKSGAPVSWLRTPLDYNFYPTICSDIYRPYIYNGDPASEEWNAEIETGECGNNISNDNPRPMALSIDAEYIFYAPPQVDINLDGRTGITDLLHLAWYLKDGVNYPLEQSQLNIADVADPPDAYDINDIDKIEEIILQNAYQYTSPIYTSLWKRPDLNYNSLFNNQFQKGDIAFWQITDANTYEPITWNDTTDATPNTSDTSFEWIYYYLQGAVCDGVGDESSENYVEPGMPCEDASDCGPGGECLTDYGEETNVSLLGPKSYNMHMPGYVYFIYYGKSG
tara:strand:+ start:1436 stop:2827 length:1392 start_codon:yes stop_codon:yes gene_type:complete